MDTETLQDDVQGKPTYLSRAGQPVITTATRDRFDAAAHAVWPRLVTRLRRAGASPEDAEDVAQEALLRAWDRNIHFTDDGDLLRWCTVVARRSHIDRIRQQARLLDMGDLASDSACRELEAVELRHVLGTVSAAMANLTELERASLQERPAAPHGDRASQVRSAVARHRARYRLRLLVGPFAAFGAALVRVMRRGAPAAAATGALAVAAALSVTLGGSPAATGPAPAGHGPALVPAATAARGVAGPPMRRITGGSARIAGGRRFRPAAPPPWTPKTIAGWNGPAGIHTSVAKHDKKPDEPMVCLKDSTLGKVCVPNVPPAR